ncbi:hypothetical protein [Streptomyces sp. NPDC048603]
MAPSSQVLAERDAFAILGPERLTIRRDRRSSAISPAAPARMTAARQ